MAVSLTCQIYGKQVILSEDENRSPAHWMREYQFSASIQTRRKKLSAHFQRKRIWNTLNVMKSFRTTTISLLSLRENSKSWPRNQVERTRLANERRNLTTKIHFVSSENGNLVVQTRFQGKQASQSLYIAEARGREEG